MGRLLAILCLVAVTGRGEAAALEQATALYESGQAAEAEAILASLDGNDPGVNYLKGRIAFDREDYKKSTRYFEQSTKANSRNDDYWLWLGRAAGTDARNRSGLGRAGPAKKARKAFEKAVEINPGNIEARSGLVTFFSGAPWFMGGDMDKAYEQVELIREVDPDRADMELAGLYLSDDEPEKAEAVYRAGLERNPDNPRFAVRLALMLHQAEKYDEAFRVLQPFGKADEPDPDALYQLGRTGALSGKHLEPAEAAMQRYLALADTEANLPIPLASAHWRMGMIYEHQGNWQSAREQYQAALALEPEHEQATDALKKLKKKG
ncbi:MAG: tetratricopeptide repeat protein [Xanthomonadales bacterium]|nr:tetratricopeptide repeat protein [Xanthomonadales bacterium]